MLGASGTFTQDAAHAANATYLTVSATITATHLGLARGAPCSAPSGCPPPTVITATATFSAVTGYLQGVAAGGQPLLLSFLPPPAAGSGLPPTAPAAVVLTAWRVTRPVAAAPPR